MLAVAPNDAVLEIGCGNGAAVELICDRLESGTITAIDRSPTMVRRARERNGRQVAAGKAIIKHAALEDGVLDEDRFDRALAINVNVFWTDPRRSLGALVRVLRPGGALCLVYQPPVAAATGKLAGELTRILPDHGFATPTVAIRDMAPTPVVCLSTYRTR